jgi:hypothetical protein
LYTDPIIIQYLAELLNLASAFKNASKACKIMGESRGTFYHY